MRNLRAWVIFGGLSVAVVACGGAIDKTGDNGTSSGAGTGNGSSSSSSGTSGGSSTPPSDPGNPNDPQPDPGPSTPGNPGDPNGCYSTGGGGSGSSDGSCSSQESYICAGEERTIDCTCRGQNGMCKCSLNGRVFLGFSRECTNGCTPTSFERAQCKLPN